MSDVSAIDVVARVPFIDLYLGDDFADIKGLEGSPDLLTPAPESLRDTLAAVRAACESRMEETGEPEFALASKEAMLRVTAMPMLNGSHLYSIRRVRVDLLNFRKIGFNLELIDYLLEAKTRGLIVIAGEMDAGKTTTAAAYVKAWLERNGGVALAIEDPPEVKLNGVHGRGRCIQTHASRNTGGYRENLIRGMRSGANLIFLGEIRDEATALEVVRASINGHLIITTIHAGSVIEAIQRFEALCSSSSTVDVGEMLASGLACVIYQNLAKVPRQDGKGIDRRLSYKYLNLLEPNREGERSHIRKRNYNGLMQTIETQHRRQVYSK